MTNNTDKLPASKGDIVKVILCLKDLTHTLIDLEHRSINLTTKGQAEASKILFGGITKLEKEAREERAVLSRRLDDIENKIDLLLRAKEQSDDRS